MNVLLLFPPLENAYVSNIDANILTTKSTSFICINNKADSNDLDMLLPKASNKYPTLSISSTMPLPTNTALLDSPGSILYYQTVLPSNGGSTLTFVRFTLSEGVYGTTFVPARIIPICCGGSSTT